MNWLLIAIIIYLVADNWVLRRNLRKAATLIECALAALCSGRNPKPNDNIHALFKIVGELPLAEYHGVWDQLGRIVGTHIAKDEKGYEVLYSTRDRVGNRLVQRYAAKGDA